MAHQVFVEQVFSRFFVEAKKMLPIFSGFLEERQGGFFVEGANGEKTKMGAQVSVEIGFLSKNREKSRQKRLFER